MMAPGIVFANTIIQGKTTLLLYPAPITGVVLHIAQLIYFTCCLHNRHMHTKTGTYLSVIIRSLVGTLDQSRHDHIDAISLHVTVTCTVAWPICSAADSHGLLQVLLRSAMLLDEM